MGIRKIPQVLALTLLLGFISCVPGKKSELEFKPLNVTVSDNDGINVGKEDPIDLPPGQTVVAFSQFKAVIQARCVSCHDSDSVGNFAKMTEEDWLISSYIVKGNANSSKIYNYLMGADSPTGPKNMPKGSSAIVQSEREIIKKYINGLSQEPVSCNKQTAFFSGINLLNAREYNNAVYDLTSVTGNHAEKFPYRPTDLYGFDNKPSSVPLTTVFLDTIYTKAEEIVEFVALNQTSYPTLFKCGTPDYNTTTCRDQLVNGFAARAFRRPLVSEDTMALQTLMGKETSALDKLKTAYISILVSPKFLLKVELDAQAKTVRNLNHYEIASRLSFLLWSSIPDSTLAGLAAQGKLQDKSVLEAQVERMLEDPKANSFLDAFTEQWLGLRALDQVTPNAASFPAYTPALKNDLRNETRLFLREVLRHSPISELVTAKFSYLNKSLADYYQVPFSGPAGPSEWVECGTENGSCSFTGTKKVLYGISTSAPNVVQKTFTNGTACNNEVFGDPAPGLTKYCWYETVTDGPFQKVTLPESSFRRGVLSQGSILTISFNGFDSRPVKRGHYILKNILCDLPKGQVPDVTAVTEGIAPDSTFKDILEIHRNAPACAGCHEAMDPVGLGFDHFDAIGKYRKEYSSRYNFRPVDTSESLYLKGFNSSYDMMDIIGNSEKFYSCVSTYSYAYSLKEPEAIEDKCTVNEIATKAKNQVLSFKDIIKNIVTSDTFIQRLSEER